VNWFYAYYFSLQATGSKAIDGILQAIAHAGRSYHSTQFWADAEPGERSPVQCIQDAATDAATDFATLRELLGEVVRAGDCIARQIPHMIAAERLEDEMMVTLDFSAKDVRLLKEAIQRTQAYLDPPHNESEVKASE